DGIRDYKVTGVQTCALPISAHLVCRSLPGSMRMTSMVIDFVWISLNPCGTPAGIMISSPAEILRLSPPSMGVPRAPGPRTGRSRSEERRVGKECECWGAVDG